MKSSLDVVIHICSLYVFEDPEFYMHLMKSCFLRGQLVLLD